MEFFLFISSEVDLGNLNDSKETGGVGVGVVLLEIKRVFLLLQKDTWCF